MANIELRGVRPSAIAGTWYPGSATELKGVLAKYLGQTVDPILPGELIGLIVPHAGYVYSGPVAAYAYRQLEGREYDTVVIVSPIHRGYLPSAGAAVTAVEAYNTPLGKVALNEELVRGLLERMEVSLLRGDDEHSLEIQLPFLQYTLGTFDLLPIMVVDQSPSFCQRLGEVLAGLLRDVGRRVLIVASTDLSHFHTDEKARHLDRVMLDLVDRYDVAGLARALAEGRTEACGGGPVIAVLTAGRALGANAARVLNYANSSDITGDKSRVVGYAAAAILRE